MIVVINGPHHWSMTDDGVILCGSHSADLSGARCHDVRQCGGRCFDDIKKAQAGEQISLSCSREFDRYTVNRIQIAGFTVSAVFNVSDYVYDGREKNVESEKYRATLDLLGVAVIQYHFASGIVLYANKAFCDIAGVSLDRLLFRNTGDFISHTDTGISINGKPYLQSAKVFSVDDDGEPLVMQAEIVENADSEPVIASLLSQQEREVIIGVIEGKERREIVHDTGITQQAYDVIIKRIKDKLFRHITKHN